MVARTNNNALWLHCHGADQLFEAPRRHHIDDFATCWRENRAVVGHGQITMTLVDIGEMKEVCTCKETSGLNGHVAIDGSAQLAMVSCGGCVDIWDVRQGPTPCKSFGDSLRYPELALRPDGQQVVTLDPFGDEKLSLWDLRRSHKAVWTTKHGGSHRMEANFKTKRMVSLDRNTGVVKAWDLSTGGKVGVVVSGVRGVAAVLSWSNAQRI